MEFINLETLYNEKIVFDFNGREEDIGINGVWFLKTEDLNFGKDYIMSRSFYLDDQRIELNEEIMVENLFLYGFSENQNQNMQIIINDKIIYKIRVPDWGNSYILKKDRVHTKIYRHLSSNIGKQLTIYETILKLPKETNIRNIEFMFNPCVHIVAIGFD